MVRTDFVEHHGLVALRLPETHRSSPVDVANANEQSRQSLGAVARLLLTEFRVAARNGNAQSSNHFPEVFRPDAYSCKWHGPRERLRLLRLMPSLNASLRLKSILGTTSVEGPW